MEKKPVDNEKHWFVAFVMSCRERRVAEILGKMDYECYVPVQREIHKWSDRKKVVERLVIPRMVFVHCTELERNKSLHEGVPGLCGYLNTGEGPGHPGIVRDKEMEAFRAMVEGGRNVTVTNEHFSPGDRVKIVEGPLSGMECEMVTVGTTRCVVVNLGALGTARMDIDISTVRKI